MESHLSAVDLERFQSIFSEAIFSDDLQTLYYAAINLKDVPARAKEHACNNLLSFYESSKLNVRRGLLHSTFNMFKASTEHAF